MAFELIDLVTGFKAGIDSLKQLKVALAANIVNAGFAMFGMENDPGVLTGNRRVFQADSSEDWRLRVGEDTIIMHESWAGSAINTAQWNTNVTTYAVAVGSSYLKLNSAASLAANGVARVTAYASIPLYQSFATYVEFSLRVVAGALDILNQNWDVGVDIESGATAPLDGVYLRKTGGGVLELVVNFNGTESTETIADVSWLPVNADVRLVFEITSKLIKLWADDVLVQVVDRPSSGGSYTTPSIFTSAALVPSFRIWSGAVAPVAATQLWIGPISVTQGDINAVRDFPALMARNGAGGYQGQSGGSMGQTCNWTNSTEPVAAALSNATPGYTTLGGQWSFAAPAGAATDFILFGFRVPVLAANSANKNVIIRGIHISTQNTGATVAGTATSLQWALGVGGTATDLSTAEGAAAKAMRRIPLGMQGFKVGDLIGTTALDIVRAFGCPLLCEPGTYIAVIVRVPIGTATGSQIIRGACYIDCYNE